MCANEIEGAEKLVSDGVGELGVASENGNVTFTVAPKTGNGELGMGNGEKLKIPFSNSNSYENKSQ